MKKLLLSKKRKQSFSNTRGLLTALTRKSVGPIRKYVTLSSLILLVIISSFLSEAFLTSANILILIRQASVLALTSLGMTLVILSGGIDLSVGGILALSVVSSAQLVLKTNFSPYLIVLTIALLGGFAGLCNGVIIAKGKAEPFLVTMGMGIILRGVAFIVSRGRTLVLGQETPPIVRSITHDFLGPFPYPVIIVGSFFLLFALIMHYTTFGRYVYAFGGDPEVLRLSGVNVIVVQIKIYMLSGMLFGIAGILHLSRINAGDPTAGDLRVLPAIAAVIIGGNRFTGGIGNVGLTVVGILIIGVINNILSLLGATYYVQLIAQGLIIIFAVIINVVSSKD